LNRALGCKARLGLKMQAGWGVFDTGLIRGS